MTNKTRKTADGGLFLSKKYPPQNKRAEITIKKTDTQINKKKEYTVKKTF